VAKSSWQLTACNRFAGVFTGIVATTLLESSSVTIIMVIAMVSSGVLTFVQSLGVVLGSSIGTAVARKSNCANPITSTILNSLSPLIACASLSIPATPLSIA
jgi:Na+/phosphate symporter